MAEVDNGKTIIDVALLDGGGNTSRVSMHRIGTDVYEVYCHDFNGSVPRRYKGAYRIMWDVVSRFIDTKKRAGFAMRRAQV